MIETCSICGNKVETFFELPFTDLQGIDKQSYIQKIGFCPNCMTFFTQNPMTANQLSNRYKNESKFEYDSENYILDESLPYIKRSNRQYNFINENIEGKYDSILEIGASSGYNLSLYKGKKVYGVEPSKNNCTIALNKYNINMFCGMFDEFLKQEIKSKFDIIFLSHVLEHIIDPQQFISQCSSLCNKYIFIEVPTFECKYNDEPFGLFCEEHVNYFTFEGLQNLMNNNNFNLVDARINFDINESLPAGFPSISTLWEKVSSNNIKKKEMAYSSDFLINRYIEINKEILKDIDKKIDEIPNDERLAIWGVGHHASMLLANTSLKNKNIIKVYDSDKRKHKYTFANKSIECFNENDIINKEIDSILLTTYTAQKAILKSINKYKDKCKIYCLY